MRHTEEADRSLTGFVAGDTRLQSNYFGVEICLYTNIVFHIIYYCRNGFFYYCLQTLFSKSGVVLTTYNDLYLHRNQKEHSLVGFDTLIHL